MRPNALLQERSVLAMKINLREILTGSKEEEMPEEVLVRDQSYSDLIAPGCVKFNPRTIEIDDRYRKAFGIRDFDYTNPVGWGSHLFGEPGMLTTISVKPSDGVAIRKAIDNTDARAGVALLGSNTASKNMESQLDRDHARSMIELMADQKKTFVNCSFLLQLDEDDQEELGIRYKSLVDTSKPVGITLDPCANAQDKALRWADPLNSYEDQYLAPRFSIDMPVETLAAALPFSATGLIDDDGTNLGVDEASSLVRANMLKTSEHRSNMNIIVTGESGKGKSFTLTEIMLDEYAKGARVIGIDAEAEQKIPCKRVHGQYISIGGSHKKNQAMLCPMQPRALNFDYDSEESMNSESAVTDVLRSTINFLRGFYQLAFGVTTRELPYLDKGLVEAYKRHGLTYDTPYEEVNFEDYPSMDEVAEVFRELSQKTKREDVSAIYEYLAEQSATGGKDGLFGNIWSGDTNIDLKSDFILFDIHALVGGTTADTAKNAQMYSILTFIWSEICRSRLTGRPLRLVIDEGHMLFGTQTDTGETKASPISAAFVSMIARRARKYNCGLLFATQQIADLSTPGVKRYGDSLTTNSTYQFIFGTKANELAIIKDFFNLSDDNLKKILDFNRGQCIFRAGKDMTYLKIDANPKLQAWLKGEGN